MTATAPVALSAGDNGTSTTKSAIATAKITITDEAKQKELTGKTAAETIASLSRDTDGAQQQLANDFKSEKINELFSATKTFLQEGNTFMANRTAEADAAKKALDGTTASLKAEQAKPQDQQNQALIRQLDAQITSLGEQKTEADRWTPGGDYGRAMTALQAAVGGNVSGGVTGLVQNASVAYLQSIGAEKIKDIADSFQTKKGEENQTSQNVRAALHAIASCAGAAVSASNCSSAAVGAASSVVINNVLSEIENTNADKMKASEKEKRKNLVGSIITGIAVATDGNAAAANNAAQIEMENNFLSRSEKKELIAAEKACNVTNSGSCKKAEELKTTDKKRDLSLKAAIDSCNIQGACQEIAAVTKAVLIDQQNQLAELIKAGTGGCSVVVQNCTPEKYQDIIDTKKALIAKAEQEVATINQLGISSIRYSKVGEPALDPVIVEDVLIPLFKVGGTLTKAAVGNLVAKNIEAKALAKLEAETIAKTRVELNSGRDAENFLVNKWFDLQGKAAQVRLDANLNVLNEKGHLPGNLATATIRVDGKMPVEVKAYSGFGNDANSVVNGFATLPAESKRILKPLVVFESKIDRAVDTEYKILENFSQQYKMNNKVSATVDLFTERSPCVGCTDVISRQFLELFPNVEVRVYHNNGKIIAYK
ncbi:hypothetical protein HA050_03695 [Iodobacter sp. HSC-16F04]|uniref:Toxin CdiA n=1 Tax=Iodobacter violaceini TaxID=3044271 RepID=A0ABX0KR99_9NEIS|nr:deaminase domain-containing protein [Iodobacter violacea]NHQ85213.1 hypothetical protein [Iodobacter violacea]